jgi:hypothetical protein
LEGEESFQKEEEEEGMKHYTAGQVVTLADSTLTLQEE